MTERSEVDAHVRGCTACQRERSVQWFFHRALARDVPRYKAPAALRRRVRAALRATQSLPAWRRWTWTLPVPAVGFAMALLVSANVAWLASLPSGEDRLAEDVVAGHVRSLVTAHAIDVASSDRHTVKPWYAGRLDFSPPVSDYAAEGFALVGGRLDYVDGRTVAALVYQRREHRVDLFAWPASGRAAEPLAVTERRGFNVLHWTRDGMRHWLVSDLEVAEMKRLAELVAASEEK